MAVTLNVNGKRYSLALSAESKLLDVLRNDLQLSGPKFGCGVGQCAACMVLVDGVPTRSCLTALSSVAGKQVTTVEGLGTPAAPHPLQTAFIHEQAAQCGFCTSGMLVGAAALLAGNPRPDDAAIRKALQGNICRCGSHMRILRAVKRAAGEGV